MKAGSTVRTDTPSCGEPGGADGPIGRCHSMRCVRIIWINGSWILRSAPNAAINPLSANASTAAAAQLAMNQFNTAATR